MQWPGNARSIRAHSTNQLIYITMRTIKQKLELINSEGSNVIEITENYKMGFITVTEMMGQLMSVAMNVEAIKEEIKTEYNINNEAIQLMLQM
jgi:hypothetical protein